MMSAMQGKTSGHPGESASSLRDIAIDRTHARDDDEHGRFDLAMDVWRGLVAGRWALIDHFQRDGRQYLVARRCHSGRLQAPRLSRREREVAIDAIRGHSNKMIGYRLGIAETTVATHLRRALVKLGIRSRTELIRLLPIQAFQTDSEPEPSGPADGATPDSGPGDARDAATP